YWYDLEHLAARMYGTTSRNHPSVARLMERSNFFVAGSVKLVQPLDSPYRHYLLTPWQTRFVFTRLGWSQVVAFHGRNPAHRGHDPLHRGHGAIQMRASESPGADGIDIFSVIGPKKAVDFLPEAILLSYQVLLDFGCYPKGKVVRGSFLPYPRYAGPREADFT